jgi:hypothetical protein
VKLGYCILKEPFSRDSIARHHMWKMKVTQHLRVFSATKQRT